MHKYAFPETLNEIKDKDILVFDIETTGLDYNTDQITQIGAELCHFEKDGSYQVLKSLELEIGLDDKHLEQLKKDVHECNVVYARGKDGKPLNGFINEANVLVPKKNSLLWVLSLNHHSNCFEMNSNNEATILTDNEYLQFVQEEKKKLSEKEALQRWVEFASTCPYAAGHNAQNFDLTFLNCRSVKNLITPLSPNIFDTMWFCRLCLCPMLDIVSPCGHIANAIRKRNGKLSSSLQDFKEAFNLESGEAHRALGDVVTTASLLKALIKTFNSKGVVELYHERPRVQAACYGAAIHWASKNWSY